MSTPSTATPSIPDVSVVIASFNTREITISCLRSLYANTARITLEIIVVDNGSTDGSVEMICATFPSTVVLQNTRNVGFAAAQNRGALAASGRYILVLNSDILFTEDSIAAMVAVLESMEPDIGVVGPRIVNGDGSLAPSARRSRLTNVSLALSIANRYFNLGRWIPQQFFRSHLSFALSGLHDNFSAHDEIRLVECVDGMCCLFKRTVLESVGLFDEGFFFDYEIIDLANRIRSQGWRILYHPGTTVVHLKHSSRGKVRSILVETTRSELRYYSKHSPRQVEFLRWTTALVVGTRMAWIRSVQIFKRSENREAEYELLQQIFRVVRQFDISTVSDNGVIPRLTNVAHGDLS